MANTNKAPLLRNKDAEALIAGLTALDDATKPIRTGVEAASASIEAMLKDIEVASTNTDVVHRDMVKNVKASVSELSNCYWLCHSVDEELFSGSDFFSQKSMEVISAGMATITDDVEVLCTAEKIISAKKTVIADIEIFSKSIDPLYKVMEAASKVLAVAFADLEAQFTAKTATLKTKQDIMERVFLHLDCSCDYLECIRIGCRAIHSGLNHTYKGWEEVSQSINDVYEDLQTASELQEDLFAALKATYIAENVISDGKRRTIIFKRLKVFCLSLDVLSKGMVVVTNTVNLMHEEIELLHLGISTVRKYLQKAMENMKGAYEGMKFVLP